MHKAAIFDMDGTLVDSERVSFVSWHRAAAEFGYDLPQTLYAQVIGCHPERTRQIFAEALGAQFPFDQARERRLRYSAEIFARDGIALKAGVFELLTYLRDLRWPMAVATSTERSRAEARLVSVGVDSFFTGMICGDDVQHSKPDPEIYLKAAACLKQQPEDCLVLEDARVGIVAAQAAGMQAILVPDLWRPAETPKGALRFDSCLEVLQWLRAQATK